MSSLHRLCTSQASYGVEDAEFAVVQLAQTTMRSELGKIRLDSVFQERMNLNHMIVGKKRFIVTLSLSSFILLSLLLTFSLPPSLPPSLPLSSLPLLPISPDAINTAAEAWGIRCMRYEIKDIMLPTKVKEAMQMQVSSN